MQAALGFRINPSSQLAIFEVLINEGANPNFKCRKGNNVISVLTHYGSKPQP